MFSFIGLEDNICIKLIYIKLIRFHFKKIFKHWVLLLNGMCCVRFEFCTLNYVLVMALYTFPINGGWWAWQRSDCAHLHIRPYFFAKELVYQDSSGHLNFYSSYSFIQILLYSIIMKISLESQITLN